jgi:hypothetical protein
VGRLVREIAAPAFARHGSGHADIALAWEEFAGPALASISRPVRLAWPRQGAGEGATLTVHVEGPRAIELQHAAPGILAAINTALGRRAVGRMRLMQAPVGRRQRVRREPAKPERPERFATIASADLRAALARLDAAVCA